MSMTTDSDRRHDSRKKEELFCPVSFELRGRRRQAFLVDISRAGAQFKTYEFDADLNLEAAGEIEYIINTNQGAAICSAKTKWVRSSANDLIWGVEFTSVFATTADPLAQLLAAAPSCDRGG